MPAESDLYEPVRAFLAAQGWDVHAEVQDCDVVGRNGDDLVVVELKRGLTLDLLAQAVRRQQLTDAVYVAVPAPSGTAAARRSRDVHPVLRRLEVGLLEVDLGTGSVHLALQPIAAVRRRQPRRVRALLRELDGRSSSENTGGSRGRRMTAYREAALHVAAALEHTGPATPKDLRALGTGDRTLGVLRGNAYGWFERVDRGVYRLTEAGTRGLAEWPAMAARKRDDVARSAGAPA